MLLKSFLPSYHIYMQVKREAAVSHEHRLYFPKRLPIGIIPLPYYHLTTMQLEILHWPSVSSGAVNSV